MSDTTIDLDQNAPSFKSRFAHPWRLAHRHRTSIAWLVAASITLFAAFVCTTIRIRDSFLDVTQLQLVVCGMWCVAMTCFLLAFGVRSERSHLIGWGVVAVLFLCCVVLT